MIPVFAYGVFKIAMAAMSAYEAYSAISDIFEKVDDIHGDMNSAKKKLQRVFDDIKQDIDDNISRREEVAILNLLANGDKHPHTVINKGLGARSSKEIKGFILQKIPFRLVISHVCRLADEMPILSLKRDKDKNGRKISFEEAVRAKRTALTELLGFSFEAISDVNLEDYMLVKQRQITAALLFEFIDQSLDWKSPLKAEVAFGKSSNRRGGQKAGKFIDPLIDKSVTTKLKRIGPDVNPFFPSPHGRGSIVADLIIPDYRKAPVSKSNLFAIVEIKFHNDQIKKNQIESYKKLLNASAKEKTGVSSGRYDNKPVSKGGRLSIFRFPYDAYGTGSKDDRKPPSGVRFGKVTPIVKGDN